MSFSEDNCMPLNKMNMTLSKDEQVQEIRGWMEEVGNFLRYYSRPTRP